MISYHFWKYSFRYTIKLHDFGANIKPLEKIDRDEFLYTTTTVNQLQLANEVMVKS